ncbi:MAG: MBL fold metallo-hydrolase [Candidatus Nanohaloarchaea archaeon]
MGKQLRKTAGIIVEGDEASLYLDPGPGSTVHCQGYDTEKLEGVIVSHAHLDHYSDAEPLIELVSLIHDNPCRLMGPESVLNGYGDIQPSVSDYHQKMCTDVINLSDRDAEVKGLEVESQEMFHSEPRCVGLKVFDGDRKFGFWTDTAYSDELVDFYSDCDTIVVNCFFPRDVNTRKHTKLDDVPKILGDSEASTVIITHFGEKFLNSDMEEEKAWLDEEVEQKVVFAEDGMEYPGDRKLSSF